MPIPDLTNTTTFPAFDGLPIEEDGAAPGMDAREEWFLVAQVKQNMTITKPTVVVADRAGDEFAITFEDRGIDLRPVKTGWTIVVPRACRTAPKEGKKGFVRVAEGRGTEVKSCTGCGVVRYCGKECQTKDWKTHKLDCKALKGMVNAWGV